MQSVFDYTKAVADQHPLQKELAVMLSQKAIPTRKVERWKYTDLSRIFKGDEGREPLVLTKPEGSLFTSQAQPGLEEIDFSMLSHTKQSDYLAWLKDKTDGAMMAQTALALGSIQLVRITQSLQKPIQWVCEQNAHQVVIFEVEENVQASILQDLVGAALLNQLIFIKLKKDARFQWYQREHAKSGQRYFGHFVVDQAENSVLESYAVQTGRGICRVDWHPFLRSDYAECHLKGIYWLTDKGHVDNQVRVEHLASHTQSTQVYKGLVDDYAQVVFNGKAVVHPHIAAIEAHQQNKNLLLSKFAEVDTKPDLEIYSDDVKCSHGATVGQLDANAIFYLRSRGLEAMTAQAILQYAFIEELLEQFGEGSLRKWYQAVLPCQLSDLL